MVEVEVELNRMGRFGNCLFGEVSQRLAPREGRKSEGWERGLREGGKVVDSGLVLWLSQKSLLFPVLVFSFQVLTLILTGSFRRAS